MINLKQLIEEGKHDYGCVMARIDEASSNKILEFNNRIINNEMLYEEEGHDYGREMTPHITIKYGLTAGYEQDEMRQLLNKVVPFDVEVKGMDIFENEKFDVVKFDVDGKELRELNELFSNLPNQDTHLIYHPHLSLAYVKKGMGKRFIKPSSKTAKLRVNLIEYSNSGIKSYYRLEEGRIND